MTPTSQSLAAWTLVLCIVLILTAGAVAVVDPGRDSAMLGLILLAAVSGLALFRPFVGAYVPVAGGAALAYVAVQALRASSGGPDAPMLYLPAATVGAVGIVLAAIIGDQVRRSILGMDDEIAARGRVIEELQLIDPTTGAYRRAHGTRMIEEEIERGQRYQTDFSLALLDVDGWADLAEARGGEWADEAIVRLAQAYTDALRPSDRLIHLGGPRFLLLLVETGMDVAQSVAERLCEVGEATLPAEVRAGVSSFPTSEVTAGGLLTEAEHALEFARAARVPVAGPDLLA